LYYDTESTGRAGPGDWLAIKPEEKEMDTGTSWSRGTGIRK
jgi:hypothetical protein